MKNGIDAGTPFEMELAHIGMNALGAEEANKTAEQFLTLLNMEKRETSASYFSGELVEIMKENGRGTHGHIGFRVSDCEAALRYFTGRGIQVIEETKKFDEKGACIFAYFKEEIGGFAIHLIQG